MVINSSSVKAKNYYTYSASGVKLRTEQRYDPTLQLAPVGTTTPANDGFSYYKNTDYVGNIIYETEKKEDAITNKTRILVDGGYYEGGVYYYYLTDHLGNNRVVANASGTVVQKNHYYPFGTAFAEGTADEQGKQPYKYNSKELDQMHGLNLYDYSARYYESAVGRFTTMDPLSEKYYSISPYAYCYNNPIKYLDPDGRAPQDDDPNKKKNSKAAVAIPFFGSVASDGAFILSAPAAIVLSLPFIMVSDTPTPEARERMHPKGESYPGITAVVLNIMIEVFSEYGTWQDKQDRKSKDAIDAAQTAVGAAILDNISGKSPSGDPAPKRPPKGIIGHIVVGSGLVGTFIDSILNPTEPNPNKPNSNNSTTETQPKQDKEEKSLLQQIKDLF